MAICPFSQLVGLFTTHLATLHLSPCHSHLRSSKQVWITPVFRRLGLGCGIFHFRFGEDECLKGLSGSPLAAQWPGWWDGEMVLIRLPVGGECSLARRDQGIVLIYDMLLRCRTRVSPFILPKVTLSISHSPTQARLADSSYNSAETMKIIRLPSVVMTNSPNSGKVSQVSELWYSVKP